MSMKVPPINNHSLNNRNLGSVSSNRKTIVNTNGDMENLYPQIDDLSAIPYTYPLTFTSIQNSSKLRLLFRYGLPCMYSGIPMIDPKDLSRLLKNRVFFRPSGEVVEVLDKFQNSFQNFEAKLYLLLKERSKIFPNKNIQELLKGVEPIYRRDLRRKQAPIFHELSELSGKLPDEYKYRFDYLMENTYKKLNEKPVIIPFSSYEFKYKLSKIAEDINNGYDVKSQRVMRKLMKEAQRFAPSTVAGNIGQQKRVLKFLDYILKKSVLKDNAQLRSLIDTSILRLNKTEIVVPFSRKAFLYDLNSVLHNLEDKTLKDKMIKTALTLPTSNESFSAFVLKIASEPPDKIGHRLMWPSLASVEHILPRSCGGENIMANYGGATTRLNSERKSIPFTQWLTMHPQAKQNCQKYLDALIDLYNKGIFSENNISPKYITDFVNTVYVQSGKKLKLDTSKLKLPQ